MKLSEPSYEFHGQVKFSGASSRGSSKWKLGSLLFTHMDRGWNRTDKGWNVDMLYDCVTTGRPVLSILLTPAVLQKFCCKGSFFMDTKTSSGLLTWYFKPPQNSSPMLMAQIQAIMDDVKNSSSTTSVDKSEVAVKKSVSPAHSTRIGVDKENVDVSSHKFTSVKENKRTDWDMNFFQEEEGKENRRKSADRSADQFLQRSTEKSRECLKTLKVPSFYGKTSSASPAYIQIPSIKRPGLMPDPSPIKRARLSDAIPYSMKTKSTTPVDQKLSQALQGFSNLGNTCYMNAILQSLFGLDSFSLDLTGDRKLLKLLPPQSLYVAMVKLLNARRQSSELARKECLRRVKSAISTSAKRFSGYGQHDAHEFLGQVLDQLKEEVLKVYKATPSPSPLNAAPLTDNTSDTEKSSPQAVTNAITINFEFEVLHTLTCLGCGEQVTKAEQFHDISLDVPKRKDLMTPRSLQDAVSMFFRNEQIEYTCEKCGNGKSDVSHKITRLPRVFILHLKRYSYIQAVAKHTKMAQNVSIPLHLTMEHHCTEATQPAHPATLYHIPPSVEKELSQINMEEESEPNSRRKLDYQHQSGYKFHKKELPSDPVEEEASTESKEKKDRPASTARRTLTLEDEVDDDMARAIEISLKEHEEKDQMRRDYGEDTEDNLERVLEMSRNRQEDQATVRKKNINELSEEEMIQLAIEQSLQDNDQHYHGYSTHTDDIFKRDHTQTDGITGYSNNQDHNYTQSGRNLNSMDFSHVHTASSRNINNNVRDASTAYKYSDQVENGSTTRTYATTRLVKSKSGVGDDQAVVPDGIGYSTPLHGRAVPVAEPVSETEVSPIMLLGGEFCRNDQASQAEKKSNGLDIDGLRKNWRGKENENDISIENNCVPELDLDKSTAELNDALDFVNKRTVDQSSASDDSSRSTLSVLSEKCRDLLQSSSWSDLDENMNKMKCNNSAEDSISEKSLREAAPSDSVNSVICEKALQKQVCKTDDSDDLPDLESIPTAAEASTCGSAEKPETARDKAVQHQEVASNTASTNNQGTVTRNFTSIEEMDALFCNEDDSWLNSVDDKENKLPLTTERPRLSDPEDFVLDDNTGHMADEVDGEAEETLDLPVIDNEKGDLPYSYRLVSIVNHMGVSSNTGHYLSDVYDFKKKIWYSFDDSYVVKTTEADVRTKRERSGYIFFYMNGDTFDDLVLHHATSPAPSPYSAGTAEKKEAQKRLGFGYK